MQRLKPYLIGFVLIGGAILLAALLMVLAPEPERRPLEPHIPFVETVQVLPGGESIPVLAAGTVRPIAEINIVSQVNGRVEWVSTNFVSGGQIVKDDVVVRIENEEYIFQLRGAEAELATQQVNLLQAEEKAVAARREYERYLNSEFGSQEDMLKASPLTLHEPQLRAAQAAFARAEARVESTQRALANTEIKAPFHGYVREEWVTPGQYLLEGSPVGSVFASDIVEVDLHLSDGNVSLLSSIWLNQDDASRHSLSARVRAKYGDQLYEWDGYVHRANASLDKETRTVEVIVRVRNPFSSGKSLNESTSSINALPLFIGKFVEVEIQAPARVPYSRIPRLALQADYEVWVVGDQQRVSIVKVDVLQRGRDEVFVSGNLRAGQRVVVSGIDFAVENMLVRSQQ